MLDVVLAALDFSVIIQLCEIVKIQGVFIYTRFTSYGNSCTDKSVFGPLVVEALREKIILLFSLGGDVFVSITSVGFVPLEST